MAKETAPSGMPDALLRREMLYGDRRVDLAALGEQYMAAGRWTDAIEAFERVPDEAARERLIGTLRDQALDAGDWFILNRVHQKRPLDKDAWRRALRAAKDQGKQRYALKIARQLEDAGEVEALELELGLREPEPPAEAQPEGEAGAAGEGGVEVKSEIGGGAKKDDGEDA